MIATWMAKMVMGCTQIGYTHFPIANKLMTVATENMDHDRRSSSSGDFQQSLSVGIDPTAIPKQLIKTAISGVSMYHHNTKLSAAIIIQLVSTQLHVIFPRFIESMNTVVAPMVYPMAMATVATAPELI